MSKIRVEYDGSAYTLEFDLKRVRSMAKDGFAVEKINSGGNISAVEDLFVYALAKNHPNMKRQKAIEIFAAQNRKAELIAAIAQMYVETINSFYADAEPAESEDAQGNATWETVE